MKNAIYTDPDDQSAWLYYWWLLGKAPEYVSLLGAYRAGSLVIVGFNDTVKFTELPKIVDEKDQDIPVKLYPVCSEDSESSSLWVVAPQNGVVPIKIDLSSNIILPSCSSILVAQNQNWSADIKQVNRGKQKKRYLQATSSVITTF